MSKYDGFKETSEIINGHEYKLQPEAYKYTEEYFEVDHNYQQLNQQAMSAFTRRDECIATPLKTDHITVLRNLLPKELCQSLIEEFEQNPDGTHSPEVLSVLVPQVFTKEVDQHLISYFDSEYCIFWWSIYKVESDMDKDGYFTKWHCDGGPRKHAKVIIYLNGYDEHGSDTGYLAEKETLQLKEVGYIFNNINNRALDISELCKHYNISFEPKFVKPEAGDCIIFNPNQVAHRAYSPEPGKTRYALNFCMVQSEANYQYVMDKYYMPKAICRQFDQFSAMALKFKASNEVNLLPYIGVALEHEICTLTHVEFLIENIFTSRKTAESIFQYIIDNDPQLVEVESIFDLLRLCKKLLQGQLEPEKLLNKAALQGLLDLADYEESFKDSFNRYSADNKPNPSAIFWPDPSHPKHPQSKFEQLPFVQKHPIMDISTPIGSAGSCFAFEIASFFQKEGYNYVVTERNDDPNSGVLIDGYTPGDTIAKFCANYGILFNTPSFSQLAEKAFGLKSFNKLLIDSDSGYYLDPYRENVLFKSPQAYMDDYDKHVMAVRESFLASKVFVVTLGLNECWQLHDGTVMSRNPRPNMYHLVKHKTLTVAENVSHIQRFFDIIKHHNPEFKLIISVSPIPFLATGRAHEHHIITANCHSKATLRVAAEELVANNEDMYYLPSYELVTECMEDGWLEDHRHVKPETVAKVVDMFKQIFVQ